jgi:Ca-activated chloride channel family protein
LRDLEDRYVAGEAGLEAPIVALSLRFGVLCRFTAFVAVDARVVNENGETRRVTQPVELPAGWAAPEAAGPIHAMSVGSAAPLPPPAASAPPTPGFAPPRMESREQSRLGSPTGPQSFAAIPSSINTFGANAKMSRRRSREAPEPMAEDLGQVLAVEARRLAEAEDRPAYERRDLLADLASRLEVLLDGRSDAAYEPVRALVATLKGDGTVDEKWKAAREVLAAFGEKPEHKPFWKR